MHENIEIRPVLPEDRDTVAFLFMKLLNHLDQFESDMLPTQKNVDYMTDKVFMPAAARGEPVLIAWHGKRPVGAIFWIIPPLHYESRWKYAYGYGTFIEDEYRMKKIGTLLREAGLALLKKKQVKKLMGFVQLTNTISMKANDRLGSIPYARVDLLDIK